MRQDFYRRMEKLERNYAATQQAAEYRNGPSGAEVMRGLLRPYAIDRLPGQSRAQTLARAAGIGTSELKDLLSGRPVRQAPAEGRPTGEPVREEKKPGSVWSDGTIGSEHATEPGEERHNESDREGEKSKSATPDFTHVDSVDSDGKVVRSPFLVQNALWKKEIFGVAREPVPETEQKRKELRETLRRVVIGIDPSGCAEESGKRSGAVGIVVAGVGCDGIARILADATGRYSRQEWTNKALSLLDRWEGDRIVAGGNSGGAMVDSTIHTARRMAYVNLVTASSAKAERAEPVAALYERGKVRHVGQFAELERQYCQFSTDGYTGAGSPNHADAAIWALTDLMLDD